MPKSEVTRVTIVWSKDTDVALRSHLASLGVKKGALSQFVEDAVKWRLFDKTVNQARAVFADVPLDELQNLIAEALVNVRREKPRRSKRGPRK